MSNQSRTTGTISGDIAKYRVKSAPVPSELLGMQIIVGTMIVFLIGIAVWVADGEFIALGDFGFMVLKLVLWGSGLVLSLLLVVGIIGWLGALFVAKRFAVEK